MMMSLYLLMDLMYSYMTHYTACWILSLR